MPDQFDSIIPRPASLVAALRSIGYGLETAVADLVDNSIAAGASRIDVDFVWHGLRSTVSIRDNGRGMSADELVEAMRPGSHDPLDERRAGDLGRFGLGLKTASFSQCRVFSVVTRKNGLELASRTWDLDFVIRRNEWLLCRDVDSEAASAAEPLSSQPSGTCIIWQSLDRLVGTASEDDEGAHKAFMEAADRVREHLAMVFGDYLAGGRVVTMYVGRTKVEKWDPFLMGQSTLVAEESHEVAGHSVTISAHVLPHHTRLSKHDWEAAAGPAGWNAQQGFYVYRNRRMLVSGGWMNLGLTREEHMKLARIRIDLDNTSDFLWQLDIRKSRATPPPALRDTLKRIARLTRSMASEVYRHRGRKLVSPGGTDARQESLWQSEAIRGKVRFRIDRTHPLVKSLIEEGQSGRSVNALLKLIEETVPEPAIFIQHSERPNDQPVPFETAKKGEIRTILRDLFLALREGGQSAPQAKAVLAGMVPFKSHLELFDSLEQSDSENTHGETE